MFPLRDENPTELVPFLTLALIAINVAVWVMVQGAGTDPGVLRGSVCAFGAIPAEITGQSPGQAFMCAPGGLRWSAVFTSMFLHGGWMHLIGNMWFLWIFGNNIEDSLGHLRFLVFYLLAGAAASAAHIVSDPSSGVPMVGASGAISGIMGAYLLLYPRIRIYTLFFFFIFIRIIPVSAWIILVYWFGIQILAGSSISAAGGGVAYWAHVGGFVAGLLLVKPFEKKQLVEAKRRQVKLDRKDIRGAWW